MFRGAFIYLASTMSSFVDIQGFRCAKVNVHFQEAMSDTNRLVVDRGFLRVQRSDTAKDGKHDFAFRLVVAARTSNGMEGSDVLFVPFEAFCLVQHVVVCSPNGLVRKGRVTIELASPIACGQFSTMQISFKMDVGDASLLCTNIIQA